MKINFIIFLIIFFKYKNNSNEENNWHNFNAFFDFSSIDTNDLVLKENLIKICQIIHNYLFLTFKIKGKQEIDLSNIDENNVLYSLVTNYGIQIRNYDYAFKVMLNDNTKPYFNSKNYDAKRKRFNACNIFILEENIKDFYDEIILNKIFQILKDIFNCLVYNFEGIMSLKNTKYNSKFNTYEIKSPKILELAKKHFNCDSLNHLWYYGSNGGYLYWLNLQMNNDNQSLYGGTSSSKISEITLGFFEDLGYYKINYNMSQINLWGLNKGCDFINNPSEKFDEFSAKIKYDSCSEDYNSQSYSLNLNEENLNYFINKSSQKCSLYWNNNSCINWIDYSNCAKSKCIIDKNNLINVEYEYNGLNFLCKKDGEIVKNGNVKIKCPVIDKFCDFRYECKNNCSGRGYCLNGDCICTNHKGFACEFNKNESNDYILNKLCNFNGYYKNNKCNCYDNYSGKNCENIIINKGSFSSKCSKSNYIKCYTGDYYNYINSSNYKKIVYHTNKNDLIWNNHENNKKNCKNFCNTCDREKNICKKCLIINRNIFYSFNSEYKIPETMNIFLTCKYIIKKFSKLNYECNKNNNLTIDKNCRIINDKNECTYCNTNIISNSINDYFLLNSKCEPVILKVKNCKKYKNSTTCKECSKGYNWISNKCIMNLKSCSWDNLINNVCYKCEKENQVIYKDKCWEINSKINKILLLLWILIKSF